MTLTNPWIVLQMQDAFADLIFTPPGPLPYPLVPLAARISDLPGLGAPLRCLHQVLLPEEGFCERK